jgi:hypothetical protein
MTVNGEHKTISIDDLLDETFKNGFDKFLKDLFSLDSGIQLLAEDMIRQVPDLMDSQLDSVVVSVAEWKKKRGL